MQRLRCTDDEGNPMPTAWKDSYVEQLHTLSVQKGSHAQTFTDRVRGILDELYQLTGPEKAVLLTAIAADVITGVHIRNDRPDVRAARSALVSAIDSIAAIGDGLDVKSHPVPHRRRRQTRRGKAVASRRVDGLHGLPRRVATTLLWRTRWNVRCDAMGVATNSPL
jgi:hypothetical protein